MKTTLLIFLAIAMFLSLIKKNKKRSERQYESDVKENADFPEAVELESYNVSDFDQEIFNNWAAMPSTSRTDDVCLTLTRQELFDFAEYYHKAKS
ncbi:hypothetical protein ACFFU1_16700 [Algibacter miyuki]|uniref:Uncharacterized protein n=1 Tax=Algibacter miyuki TaxID=1306933 RepID=A0ABV5H5G1_9FLAO|nr:hypothetical protein [Algibacter miyuki]MDN3665619.1 hypothetical protein [Algibacter miyuki]